MTKIECSLPSNIIHFKFLTEKGNIQKKKSVLQNLTSPDFFDEEVLPAAICVTSSLLLQTRLFHLSEPFSCLQVMSAFMFAGSLFGLFR